MTRSAPRSIDEYLAQLRDALAGEDPAVIQDALYDSEEYLRAEAAANAGMPEADLLGRILHTYGTPDEVAAGYRDTEVKVKTALQLPAPRYVAPSNVLKRFFAVYLDPRAYSSIFYMLLSLATGCLYFTYAVTGLSLSAGLAILIIGLPVFLGFIGIARVMSLGEGYLLEAVSGERMPRRPVHPGPPADFLTRIKDMLVDSQTWLTLIYFLLMLPLGIVYFTTIVTALSLGVSFLLLPYFGMAQRWGWWTPWHDFGRISLDPWWLDTPAGWVFSVIFGIVLITTTFHLARGVVSIHARAAKALLVTQAG